MPRHREVPTREFMPKAWGAMCAYRKHVYSLISDFRGDTQSTDTGELLGGEDRVDPTLFESCGDSLIVNLGAEEWADVSTGVPIYV